MLQILTRWAPIAGVFALLSSVTPVAAAGPSLVFHTTTKGAWSVVGAGWGRHVVVSVPAGVALGGISFKSSEGGFEVTVRPAMMCGGVSVEARDFRGDVLSAHRPGPLCASRAENPELVVSLIPGSGTVAHNHVVSALLPPRTLTVRLGHTVELPALIPGKSGFVPTADVKHFLPVASPGVVGTACTQLCGSASAEIWSWAAFRRGTGTIVLTRPCALAHPVCRAPDMVVRVSIV